MDSLGVVDLLEALGTHGFTVDYERLLSDAALGTLAQDVGPLSAAGPIIMDDDKKSGLLPLSGAQSIWATLETAGWADWCNISLCVSIPAASVAASDVPKIVRKLCDQNDALRMVLVRGDGPKNEVFQKVLPHCHVPVELRDAPRSERDAMRIVEGFEGRVRSPFEPSTEALVMTSDDDGGRHWLCLTMHHVFADRIAMQSLKRQIEAIIAGGDFGRSETPQLGYGDVAVWQSEQAEFQRESNLPKPGFVGPESMPECRLDPGLGLALGDLPTVSFLSPSQVLRLEACAKRLGSTAPTLLQVLFHAVIARLTSGETPGYALTCQVASNREQHPSLKDLVGCFDTSIPVQMSFDKPDTSKEACKKALKAFTEGYADWADEPRGGWLKSADRAELFTRVPHINVVRLPPAHTPHGVQDHSVQRVQRTHWGALLRVWMPALGHDGVPDQEMRIAAFAEDRALAVALHHCFSEGLNAVLRAGETELSEMTVQTVLDDVFAAAGFAAAHVQTKTSHTKTDTEVEGFIYDRLIERQKRWYRHDDHHALVRDANNRFVGTVANPFPFTQLDKLKERAFLTSFNIPQPSVLHVLSKDDLPEKLIEIAPSLPSSFALKPVGAGHSFGVTLVKDSRNLMRGGSPFDAAHVGAELSQLAAKGYCRHEGKEFRFNFSAFVIEDLVEDECGFETPTDYKLFMLGGELLWIQLHFKADGFTWVAFVDEDFTLLSQPAWTPSVCWRTHRALVCDDPSIIAARKPRSLSQMVKTSREFGRHLGMFVRLDWYADAKRGPLMGEITLFPHMLQPRNFYSAWANERVAQLWQNPEGARANIDAEPAQNGLERVGALLEQRTGLLDFLPSVQSDLWAVSENLTYGALRRYIDGFDLSGSGVARGARVGLIGDNGTAYAGVLLALMHRYCAVPAGGGMPSMAIETFIRENDLSAVCVEAGTTDAEAVRTIAARLGEVSVVELSKNAHLGLMELDVAEGREPRAEANGPDDTVLILRTSGTTGEPKQVPFSLSRVMRSGWMIANSLNLTREDSGVSMLPLRHVGGITCNLIAPLLSGSSMRFLSGFDQRAFFKALKSDPGASWVYLVPAMWSLVGEYARAHPDLKPDVSWPKLRALRSAGADLPMNLAQDLADIFGKRVSVVPTYGMTEAMPIAAPSLPYRLEHPGEVGSLLPGVDVEVIDPKSDGKHVLPDGAVGEVTVKSPTVMAPSACSDERSASDFTSRGYFRTGDLGCLSADGENRLTIKGRIKDCINRGGETLVPTDVEATLRQYNGSGEQIGPFAVMAFARNHITLGEDVGVAVTADPDRFNARDFWDWAKSVLPAYQMPSTIVLVDSLPATELGKLQRTRFAQTFNAHVEAARIGAQEVFVQHYANAAPERLETFGSKGADPAAARTKPADTLSAVCHVIQDFVERDEAIAADTCLDDLGINSLAALELVTKLNQHFDADLPPWIISDVPTPRGLSEYLRDATNESAQVTPRVGKNEGAGYVHSGRPTRVLVLHGEAADAALMEASFQATHWSTILCGQVEFVYLDAPHTCTPKPEFHQAAVDAGFYSKDRYRSWGATEVASLETSLDAVRTAIDELGPIDGIAGICDGALVAALVASERPNLQLLLVMSPNPLERLHDRWAMRDWSVACPSLHLISPNDPMNGLPAQIEVSLRCKRAVLIQHDRGHAVPTFDAELREEFERIFGAVLAEKPGAKETASVALPGASAGTPKRAGERLADIEMAHIERTVCDHMSVGRAAVGYFSDPQTKTSQLVAFVMPNQDLTGVVRDDDEATDADLRTFLSANLSEDHMPDRIVPIDALPLTAAGEVDFQALALRFSRPRPDYVAPRNALEEDIAGIWKSVLMLIEAPGIDDDFFDLGGYSMLSLTMLRELEKRSATEIGPEVLVGLSTVRALASKLQSATDDPLGAGSGGAETLDEMSARSGLSEDVIKGLLANIAAWDGVRSKSNSFVFGKNTEGQAQPIFWCFQGYNEFAQLARYMGEDQPIYGMRSGVRVLAKTIPNAKRLARLYVSDILNVQPDGPYIIGGNCQSAMVAFQIAKELLRRGKEMSLLFLHEQVSPQTYDGRVALFFGDSSFRNPQKFFKTAEKGWERFYSGRVATYTVGGEHGKFFDEPNIQTLVAAMKMELRAVEDAISGGEQPTVMSSEQGTDVPAISLQLSAPERVTWPIIGTRASVNVRVTNAGSATIPEGLDCRVGFSVCRRRGAKKIPLFYGFSDATLFGLRPDETKLVTLKVELPSEPGKYVVEFDTLINQEHWGRFDGATVAESNLDTEGLVAKASFKLKKLLGRGIAERPIAVEPK